MDMLSLSAVAGAFLLLAHSAVKGGNHRRAFFFVFLGLLAFGLAGQVMSALGTVGVLAAGLNTITALTAGLLLGGFYLAARKGKAKAFLVPGVAALVLVGGLHLVAQTVSWTSAQFTTTQDHVKGQFLLELGPDDTIDELKAVLKKYDARAERAFPNVTLAEDEDLAQFFIVHTDQARVSELMAELSLDKENVDSLDFNYTVKVNPLESQAVSADANEGFLANDPMVKKQWGFIKTEGDSLHKRLKKLRPKRHAIVAIVDTGVDRRHEDIASVFDASPGDRDGNGHGTHCAGIAGAATNNGIGVASYNWAGKFIKIRGYKALSDSGSGTIDSVCKAIIDAARDGADVISMSLGGYSPTPPRAEVAAVKFALRRGCIVIVAAGNSNDDARNHAPANIDGVITVAALNQNLAKARFSNTNTKLKMPIAAPGVDILSLRPGKGYVNLSGTSMATPMVSGLVGVMRSLNPKLDTKQAYDILVGTGIEISDAHLVGKAINAPAAIEASMKKK